MTTEEYNGWTNRETWVLNLWINNDETWYKEAWEKAAEIIGSTPAHEQAYYMATWLERWTESVVTPTDEEVSDSINGLVSDLLGTLRINYREVASAILLGVSEDLERNSEGVTP